MLKKIVCVAFIVTCFAFTGFTDTPQPNIAVLRKQLVEAIDKSKTTDSLYNKLGLIKQPSALITGYIGALEALKAKHTWNPYFKLKYLNSSEASFDEAVLRDPGSIEIRFMRFSVEHNVPGFLGYKKNISADKQMIIRQIELKNYEHTDKELIVTAINFLLNSKQCSLAENLALHKQLAILN